MLLSVVITVVVFWSLVVMVRRVLSSSEVGGLCVQLNWFDSAFDGVGYVFYWGMLSLRASNEFVGLFRSDEDVSEEPLEERCGYFREEGVVG